MPNMDKNGSWPLVGNENITEFLSKHIKNGAVAGSYIFSGRGNLGKKTLAYFFAQSLLCQKRKPSVSEPCGVCPSCRKFLTSADTEEWSSGHSDLYAVEKEDEKKNISIDQVRELIKKLSLSSFLNSYKIGIIDTADALSIEAANALLKTLEEPRNKVVVILITADIESLPATIVSRSRVLRFNAVTADKIYDFLIREHKLSRSAAKNFSRLAAGRPALAVKLFQDKKFYEGYTAQAGFFLDFFKSDLNARFSAIEELVGKKTNGQQSVKLAKEILEVWQGLARDILLVNSNHGDLIRNESLAKDLEAIRTGSTDILKIIESISRAGKYIQANVSPKAALESVAVNI